MQLRLVSPMAGFFDGADLLLAADCSAFARGDFHARYMKGKVTVIGCPKLDPVDYSEKLTEIFRLHNIRSVTLVRMGSALLRRPGAGGAEGAGCLRTPDPLRKRHPFGTGRDPLDKKRSRKAPFFMRSKKASDKTEQLRLQLHHPQSSVFVSLSSLPFLVSKTNLVFLGTKF